MSAIATAGMKVRGFEGQIYYTPSGGASTKAANVIDFDLMVKGDTVEGTDKSTSGWKDKECGLLEWSGTAKLNLIQSGADVTAFYSALLGNAVLAGTFRPQDLTGGLQWAGYFRILSFKVAAPMNGLQTYDIGIEGTGPLTLGTVVLGGS